MLIVCGKCQREKNPNQFYNAWGRGKQKTGKHVWCKKCCTEYASTRYRNDPAYRQKRASQTQAWYRANPERFFFLRDRARARTRGATLFMSFAEWQIIRQGGICHWCKVILHPSFTWLEHIVPLADGGQHTKDNVVVACANCNCRREWERHASPEWKQYVNGRQGGTEVP